MLSIGWSRLSVSMVTVAAVGAISSVCSTVNIIVAVHCYGWGPTALPLNCIAVHSALTLLLLLLWLWSMHGDGESWNSVSRLQVSDLWAGLRDQGGPHTHIHICPHTHIHICPHETRLGSVRQTSFVVTCRDGQTPDTAGSTVDSAVLFYFLALCSISSISKQSTKEFNYQLIRILDIGFMLHLPARPHTAVSVGSVHTRDAWLVMWGLEIDFQ